MKTIPLTRGLVTIVDDDVYEWASKFIWSALVQRSGKPYAVRTEAGKCLYLHRQIMGAIRGEQIDQPLWNHS